jgi:hypothetical protein
MITSMSSTPKPGALLVGAKVETWWGTGEQSVPRSAWVKTDAANTFAVLLAVSVSTYALRGTFCTPCTPISPVTHLWVGEGEAVVCTSTDH